MSALVKAITSWAAEAVRFMDGQPFVAVFSGRPATRYGLVAGLLKALSLGQDYKAGHTYGGEFWADAMLKTKEAAAFAGPAFEANGIFVKDNQVQGKVDRAALIKVYNKLIPSGIGAMEGMLGTITIAHVKAKSTKVPTFGLLSESPVVRYAKQGEKFVEDGYAGAKVVLSQPKPAVSATVPASK